MKTKEIWKTLGYLEKTNEVPSQLDLDKYNEIIYQRKTRDRNNAIKREIEARMSKISDKIQREIAYYPSDSELHKIFLDNIQDMNGFIYEQKEIEVILKSKDPKNKQVQAVLKLIKELENPQLEFEPVSLDQIDHCSKQLTDTKLSINNTCKSTKKSDAILDYLKHKLNKVFKDKTIWIYFVLICLNLYASRNKQEAVSEISLIEINQVTMPLILTQSNEIPAIEEMQSFKEYFEKVKVDKVLDEATEDIIYHSIGEYLRDTQKVVEKKKLVPLFVYTAINEPNVVLYKSFITPEMKEKHPNIEEVPFLIKGFVQNNKFQVTSVDVK